MRSLWVWLFFLTLCSAQELPEAWRVQGSADGRFLVSGNQPEVLQNLLVWSLRSVGELEKQFRMGIPFAPGQTLGITLDPGISAPELRGNGRSAQEIRIPDTDLEGRVLAEAFVRACLQRVLGMDPPGWLVAGFAPSLLDTESKDLFEASLLSAEWERFPSPESLLHVASRDHPRRAVAAIWLHRWLSRSDGPLRRDAPAFWRAIAEQPQPPAEQWIRWGNATDLRDLHIRWDLWRLGQQHTLMAELRIESLARKRLGEWLNVRPAEMGLDGAAPRYAPLRLPELETWLTEAWTADFLRQWMLRVQPLRFRQNDAFNQEVGTYLDAAGLLLLARQRTGRNRQDTLAQFREKWAEAEALRPANGDE